MPSRDHFAACNGTAPVKASSGKKIAEGKTGKETLRALKRRISDAIYARLRRRPPGRTRQAGGPGRANGERL